MPEGKRVRRTPQQMAQDLDAQMEKLNASIAELEEKKAASAAVFDGKIATVRGKIKSWRQRKKTCWRRKSARHARRRPSRLKTLCARRRRPASSRTR